MKKYIKYILSFITFMSFTFLTIFLILSCTILNKSFILKQLEKNDYYQKTYDLIIDDFENNLIQSGVNMDTATKIVNIDIVKADINQVIAGIYTKSDIKLSTQEIKNNLDTIINNILAKNNRVPSAEEKEDIKTLEETISKIYENNISYSINDIKSLPKIIEVLNNFMLIIIIFLVIITVILSIVLIKKHHLKSLMEAVLSAGLFMMVIRFLLGSKLDNIVMFNQVFSDILTLVITNILNLWLTIGIIYSIISLLLIIIYNSNKKRG